MLAYAWRLFVKNVIAIEAAGAVHVQVLPHRKPQPFRRCAEDSSHLQY